MKRVIVYLNFLLLGHLSVNAQNAPNIQWQQPFGGSNNDIGYSISNTNDGGFITAGVSNSNDGDVSGNHGSTDFWITKFSNSGVIEWQKSLGGSKSETALSIKQTFDGGYIAVGTTSSSDGDVSGYHGGLYDPKDIWVVKLNNIGNIEWQRAIGGPGNDVGQSIIQTSDSNYVIAGGGESTTGDVTGNHSGYTDGWVIKFDQTGSILWTKAIGGSYIDGFSDIKELPDGSLLATGSTASYDGDVIGHLAYSDFWLVKLSSDGTLINQKCLGGSSDEYSSSLSLTPDGGCILVGQTNSSDIDVNGQHGFSDYWAVKVDSSFNIQWQKTLGGTGIDRAYCTLVDADGNCLLAGYTYSRDGDLQGRKGKPSDIWVVKLSSMGNLLWQKVLGETSGDEIAYGICQSADSSYLITGYSNSYTGLLTGTHGSDELWIVKLYKDAHTPSVSITSDPPSPICSRTNVTFTATPGDYAGSTPTYQWKRNNRNVGTGPTYSLINLANNDSVWCVMTSSDPQTNPSTASSNKIIYTVNSKPSPTSPISGPTTVAANQDSIQFSVTPVSGVSYTWIVYAGTTIISGQGTNSVLVKWGTRSTYIKVKATNTCGSSPLTSLYVTVNSPLPLIANNNTGTLNNAVQKIYPNPATNKIYISEGISAIQIFDNLGRLKITKSVSSGMNRTIDISNLSPGLYLVTLTDNLGNTHSEKLLVE